MSNHWLWRPRSCLTNFCPQHLVNAWYIVPIYVCWVDGWMDKWILVSSLRSLGTGHSVSVLGLILQLRKPTCVRIQLKFIRPRAMQRICDLSVGVGVQVCCRNFQNEVSWRYIFTDFASVEKLKMKDKEEGDCGRYAKIQRDRVTGQDRSRERD